MMTAWNDYPNADNYMTLSFPQPVPAPDVDPDEGSLMIVGYNPLWKEVLMAACDQLLQFAAWQGDNAAKMLAVNRAETLKYLLQNPVEAAPEYPTPFWDEASDLDDEAPADTQEWYGYVTEPEAPADELTFIENATIWAFTGFIAYAGDIGAALFFRTIATSWVLAWRRGSLGEVIRVIVDGAEYGRIDTGSAAPGDLVQMPILAGDGAHDITMIKVA